MWVLGRFCLVTGGTGCLGAAACSLFQAMLAGLRTGLFVAAAALLGRESRGGGWFVYMFRFFFGRVGFGAAFAGWWVLMLWRTMTTLCLEPTWPGA